MSTDTPDDDHGDEAPDGSATDPENRDLVPEGLTVERIEAHLEDDEFGIALTLLLSRLERELGFIIKDKHGLGHEEFLDTWQEAAFGKFVKMCITLQYLEDHEDTLELLGRYRSNFIHNQQYMRDFLDDPDERETMKSVIEQGIEIVEDFNTKYH